MHTETANFGVRDIMWTLSHIFMDTQLLIIAFFRIRTFD